MEKVEKKAKQNTIFQTSNREILLFFLFLQSIRKQNFLFSISFTDYLSLNVIFDTL